jgi:ABC-2 type transport system ATP-binding protein
LDVATIVLPEATPDQDALVLQVPTDGTPKSLEDLLNRLDEHAVCVERVTVHSADLDDVFFALTGDFEKGLNWS